MRPAQPRPLEVPLRISEIPYHRNLTCPRYDFCLGYAASLLWESFTCASCENRFIRRPFERPQAPSSEGDILYTLHLTKEGDPL